jgi:hypothetical protein
MIELKQCQRGVRVQVGHGPGLKGTVIGLVDDEPAKVEVMFDPGQGHAKDGKIGQPYRRYLNIIETGPHGEAEEGEAA